MLYVTNHTRFATHQGVKGLEFPRVMVIMDDAQARGFLFSYEKLFGAKAQSDTDVKNKREGKDTSITRTARLFYVACTRAQKSLAVVAYTANVESVKNTALSNGWFSEDEIYILQNIYGLRQECVLDKSFFHRVPPQFTCKPPEKTRMELKNSVIVNKLFRGE